MITIGICTYNRIEPLRKSIENLGAQDLSGLPEIELLVALNNSPEETRKVVEETLPKLPFESRGVGEPTPGLNFARNRILSEARGNIIVYTDDDVVRKPNWLQEIIAPFSDPNVAAVGGRILPRFSRPLPSWFKYPCYDGTIVRYDLGDRSFDLKNGDLLPYGASMAFRSKVFEEVGVFGANFTLCPGSHLSADETEFLIRMQKAGFGIHYAAKSVTYHPIGEDRLTKAYIRERFKGLGVSWARLNYEREKAFPRVFRAPRHLYRSIWGHRLLWLAAALRFRESAMFLHSNQAAYYKAIADEFRLLDRNPMPPPPPSLADIREIP